MRRPRYSGLAVARVATWSLAVGYTVMAAWSWWRRGTGAVESGALLSDLVDTFGITLTVLAAAHLIAALLVTLWRNVFVRWFAVAAVTVPPFLTVAAFPPLMFLLVRPVSWLYPAVIATVVFALLRHETRHGEPPPV